MEDERWIAPREHCTTPTFLNVALPFHHVFGRYSTEFGQASRLRTRLQVRGNRVLFGRISVARQRMVAVSTALLAPRYGVTALRHSAKRLVVTKARSTRPVDGDQTRLRLQLSVTRCGDAAVPDLGSAPPTSFPLLLLVVGSGLDLSNPASWTKVTGTMARV